MRKNSGWPLAIQPNGARAWFVPLRVEMQPSTDCAMIALLKLLNDGVPHVPTAYGIYSRPAFGYEPTDDRQPHHEGDSALHQGRHSSSERIDQHAVRERPRRVGKQLRFAPGKGPHRRTAATGMADADGHVISRQQLLLEGRDGGAMNIRHRRRLLEKSLHGACQSTRCDVAGDRARWPQTDVSGHSRRISDGPAMIKAHDRCSERERLGYAEARFLMKGRVEQRACRGQARQ